jgi:hypothetical protein
MGVRISCKGGSFFYISCCSSVEQRPVLQHLCLEAIINFVEGNDNEEDINNLHTICTDVGGNC